MNHIKRDLTGTEVNGNLILCRGPNSKWGSATWLRRCACGNESWVPTVGTKQPCIRCSNQKKRILEGEAAFNALWFRYIRCANQRWFSWCLSVDEFRKLTKSNCRWCGTEPRQVQKPTAKSSAAYIYNGVDRLDSNLGYDAENCVPCCKQCNRAKGKLSVEKFIAWITAAYKEVHKCEFIQN